jgi:hypothetical protein
VRPAHEGATLQSNFVSVLEKKMMQKIARSIIQVWLLSVAILISGAHYNGAQAQDNPKQHRMAVACGKELRKQCGGGAVAGVQLGLGTSSVLACFQKIQKTLPEPEGQIWLRRTGKRASLSARSGHGAGGDSCL